MIEDELTDPIDLTGDYFRIVAHVEGTDPRLPEGWGAAVCCSMQSAFVCLPIDTPHVPSSRLSPECR